MDPTALNLASVVQPIVELAGTVIAGVLVLAGKRAVDLLNTKLGITLTAAQTQTLQDVAHTGAGVVASLLQRGALKIEDVHVQNDQIRALAQTALAMAPMAAASLGVTQESMAHMIVGRVAAYGHLNAAIAASIGPPAPT